MDKFIAVAVGGAAGSVARYWLSSRTHDWLGRGFPYGTLLVNILGAAAIGVAYVWLVERARLGPLWPAALMTGVLGGFTTFSTFSLETVELFTQGEFVKAVTYIALSVIVCLGATWLGMIVARSLG